MDKLTKVLLAAIALGVWMNVARIWQPARAQPHGLETDTSSMALALSRIALDLNQLVDGTCKNRIFCRN
jgi:hypothetical protein